MRSSQHFTRYKLSVVLYSIRHVQVSGHEKCQLFGTIGPGQRPQSRGVHCSTLFDRRAQTNGVTAATRTTWCGVPNRGNRRHSTLTFDRNISERLTRG